jgi:hypothetical protein
LPLLGKTALALLLATAPNLRAQQPWPQNPQSAAGGYQGQYPQPAYGQPGSNGDDPYGERLTADDPQQAPAQSFSPAQLEQLLAPIALYPDTLIAQMLAAATYPAQVAAADNWLRSTRNAAPEQIAAAANAQTGWDPSVKALTAFPQVLAMMDRDLQWTTDLGNAYYNQPQDVLQTVQVLRQRAQAAGNLQSTPQESVQQDQGYIQLAPPNPQVVYVPTYNPWQVYGRPVDPYPGFSLLGAIGSVASFVGRQAVNFGPGIAMGAFNSTPFGWVGWALNWLTQSVLFNHSTYYSHSPTVAHWGGPSRFGGRQGGYARLGGDYARTEPGYRRNGEGYGSSPFGRPPARSGEDYAANRFGAERSYGNSFFDGGSRFHQAPYRTQPVLPARQPSYARPNGSGAYGGYRPGESMRSYATPRGESYASAGREDWRAPERMQPREQSGGYANPGNRSYAHSSDRAYAGGYSNSGHGGGFHLFGGGGGHNTYHAPKAPKGFSGGGRHSGGGSSGGHHSGGGSHHHR